MDKSGLLAKIAKAIEKCGVCKENKSGKAVVGEGSADAKVIFIGEAPGRKEAATGRPFVGRSGQLLRSLIREAGLKEEDVYITSPVKYSPDSGTPTVKDIEHGKIHLQKQLDIIAPKIIVLLGRVATLGVLGEMIAINKMHGVIIDKDDKKYFITFHPAAALRFPPLKEKLIEDFKKLKKLLET
ncbi:MAG: uracil-DNA glycosylase [Candidatus Levybacteria bacterium]|nr:uracil-DNA glycosylase [Candidatus Levybacteria bacterium]